MNSALIGSVLTALGAVVRSVQRVGRWDGLRSEISSTRELAVTFDEDSPTREKLLGLADVLSDRLIDRRTDALNTRREWPSVVFALLLAGASGFWAREAPWLWLKILLWVVVGLLAMSSFGMLFPKKPREKKETAAGTAAGTTPIRRAG
jgi:hypothetical protein